MNFLESVPLNVVAVMFSATGSFFTAIGLITMKISNIQHEKERHRRFYTNCVWLFGVMLLIVS